MERFKKEIKINPPEGYEIDRENSTFDCIKFKKIINRWRDNSNATANGYWINALGYIMFTTDLRVNIHNGWSFAEKKQAESAFAMARISQIMANDERFGGIITDKEWNANIPKYIIERSAHKIVRGEVEHHWCFLAFHEIKQRELFLEENEDLIKDYLMLN